MKNKIALVSTVKSPILELKMFVHYHLNIGINEVILFFDDPNDLAISLFDTYTHVHCNICSDTYWRKRCSKKPTGIEDRQIINVNAGEKIALNRGCKWLVHIDSDELIYSPYEKNINNILQTFSASVIVLSLREAIANKEGHKHIFEPTWFKKIAKPNQLKYLNKIGSVFKGEFIRGHLASKSIVKLDGNITKHGIHRPLDYKHTPEKIHTDEIMLLHFDCIGISSWSKKWQSRLDGSATANNMRKNRRLQLECYKNAQCLGNEALNKLYQRMHTIPFYEKILLLSFKMIQRITIEKEKFNKH